MNTPFVFKKCSKCGRWLVASTINFSKRKDGKYGLHSWCKECRSDCDKKWREENKEKKKAYDKKYYEEHKEYYAKQKKNYYEENKEEILKQHKKYNKTPQGQVVMFNGSNRRRQREEQQGNGITTEQWLEMMKFFDWKCAYSGEYIGGEKNQNIRSIDHLVPIAKDGAHEVWNLVPMDRSLNSSKNNKDLEEWYLQQDFYDEDRLNKINEWREYAYNKWSNDEIQKTI